MLLKHVLVVNHHTQQVRLLFLYNVHIAFGFRGAKTRRRTDLRFPTHQVLGLELPDKGISGLNIIGSCPYGSVHYTHRGNVDTRASDTTILPPHVNAHSRYTCLYFYHKEVSLHLHYLLTCVEFANSRSRTFGDGRRPRKKSCA